MVSCVPAGPDPEPGSALGHFMKEWRVFFRLFRFYTETESFEVSLEPKQTEDQPKLFESEHIFFYRKFRIASVCFG